MIFWKFKIVMTEKFWWQKNDKLFNLRKMHVCIIDYTFQETKILISINKKWSKSEKCFWFCLSERTVKAFRSGKCERAFAVLPTMPNSSPTCCFPFSFHTLSREEKTPTAPLHVSACFYSLETVTSWSFHLSRTWKLRASRDFHGTGFHSSVGISRRKCFSLSLRARSQKIFLVSIEKARKYFFIRSSSQSKKW